MASLLEVGTGFHPELTGRENIYLNGAILGMTRQEIRRKFDEIVAFAEVEKFLDTPVKRYSSGMYVRLAFAVAAHLEPEILIVDEVLAVGDVEFQKKCIGKMDEVSRSQGRTVLFVSHNLAAVSELTDRAVLLESGKIAIQGNTACAISAYMSRQRRASTYLSDKTDLITLPYLKRADIITSEVNGVHQFGMPLEISFHIKHDTRIERACFSFQILNQFHQPSIHAWALYPEVKFGNEQGETTLLCRFPSLKLNVGQYSLRTNLTGPPHGDVYEKLDGICSFEVVRNEQRLWDWQPSDCAYHEEWVWSVHGLAKSGASGYRPPSVSLTPNTWSRT